MKASQKVVFSILSLTISLTSFLVSSLAWAAHEKEGYLVDANILLQSAGKDLKTQGKVILPASSVDWSRIAEDKSGIMVFARRVSNDAENVEIQYMIVDNNTSPYTVLSRPTLNTKVGETTETSQVTEGKTTLKLESHVTKVRYELD